MLRRPLTKSKFQIRLEKAFPWMVLAIVLVGVFINAMLTIQYRTEEHLAEKQACRDGTASLSVNCSVYFDRSRTDEEIVEPVAKTNLSEAP